MDRIGGRAVVRIVHDTSEFVFKGERDGLMPPVQKEAKGFAGHFEWQSAVIAVAAAVALLRYKRSVMQVIAASAVCGLALKFFL